MALLGFILISTETMPAGILSEIATGMGTSEGTVGLFVSAYALGTVLVTIPAITLTRGLPRKPLLIVGSVGFLLANTVTALSSDVALSLAARFVAGGFSGMLWGLLAGYAVRITPDAMTGRALSLISVGAPVGIAFGTPLGTWLGTTFDWRWSFGGLSVLTVALLGLSVFLLPHAGGQPAQSRLPLAQVFRIPGVAALLVVIFAWMLGSSTTYTYIAPFLGEASSGLSVEIALLVFGVACIGGLVLTAWFVDRHPRTLVVASLATFSVAGVILVLCHRSPVAVYGAVTLWGLAFGGASPQLQRPLSAVSGANADVANSFLPVAFNLAIFAAGVLGAGLLTSIGPMLIPLTMTVFGLAALATIVLRRRTVYPTR